MNLLGIFASGGIAVPLCTGHPAKEMRYVLGDSTPTQLLASAKFTARAEEILDGDVGRLVRVEELPPGTAAVDVSLVDNDWVQTNRGALIIYTSGTTNLPKGVVSTHASLAAQAGSLITAWDMSPADHLLHVLPLHHVHGVVNGTLAPLMSGGTVEYLFPFTAPNVWTRLVSQTHDPITLFMAVPTIYSRLITTLPTLSSPIQSLAPTAVRRLRLAISGSAALPSSIRSAWRSIAGSPIGGGTMLERYGMSEIGMALSNRLDERVDNAVGWPLPGVEARLVNEDGSLITAPHTPGEIQIRGATVFREYWGKPAATAAEFTPDRWFRTGDVAAVDEDGCYFIHGRRSVDIIKSGGEKVSALEVERELLELEQVAEAAVVGVEDEDWGQRVAAVVVLSEAAKTEGWKLEDMRKVMKGRVAAHKVPSVMKVVDVIERNQMGKSMCGDSLVGVQVLTIIQLIRRCWLRRFLVTVPKSGCGWWRERAGCLYSIWRKPLGTCGSMSAESYAPR